MKIYVTARFKGAENKSEIEALCGAVRASGYEDFCFVRDVEHYQHTFDDLTELWECSRKEIEQCDCLLIDVSDQPTGGRVVEAGIAYGLRIPIIVIVKKGVDYKALYNGIGAMVIQYNTYEDIIPALQDLQNNVTTPT